MRKRKLDPISDDIRDKLLWLPADQRIQIKIGVLVYVPMSPRERSILPIVDASTFVCLLACSLSRLLTRSLARSPACSLSCLPARLLACLLARLLACSLARLLTCSLARSPACPLACLPTSTLACLLACLPSRLLAWLLACLLTCLLAHLLTCSPPLATRLTICFFSNQHISISDLLEARLTHVLAYWPLGQIDHGPVWPDQIGQSLFNQRVDVWK